MEYNECLIQLTTVPESSEESFSLVCLHGERFSMTLNDVRCYLDGYYLLCLNPEDRLTVHGGDYHAMTLHFLPYFYNVNLNHEIISLTVYEEMRLNHGYPDFHLFRIRDKDFFGVLPCL